MGLFDYILELLLGGSDRRPQNRPVRDETPAPKQSPAMRPPPVLRENPAVIAPKPVASQKDVKLKLDAAQFTPLSNADARKEAKKLGSPWGAAWFGRRDIIPPADDPRTKIIDRAMVGAGLVTPEELVEYHRVGDEMARLKPDLEEAHRDAGRAVEADKAERAERKKQKQAEAAKRKLERAEAVAHRKKTDIIFLGRGVSKHLADRRANIEKLNAAKLPVLATPADVANALGISIKRLRWLAFHSEAASRQHYVKFTIPKKSGGTRELSAPHKDLAKCQRWIFENILRKVPVKASAHGFVTGRSTVTNATPHAKADVVVNTDLKDFFPSIEFKRVRGIFHQLGYSPAAATILALLCTEAPRREVLYAGKKYHVATGARALPQGACTSPALSNLAARGLDSRLGKICEKLGWTYTRYADDLTFSSSGAAAEKPGYLLARVRHIAQDEDFEVNEKKTRIQRRNTAQTVTGIVVNERPGIDRHTVRRIRAILHRAKSEGLSAQNKENLPHFESWLRGTIGYIKMVNPKQGAPLEAALAKVADS